MLDKDTARELIPAVSAREALRDWWLTVYDKNSTTPNWDIASTCAVGDSPGLLLVEVKAYERELRREECAKRRDYKTNSRNHARIGWCIEDASLVLSNQTALTWRLSRDSRYKMANRFA
jgi:hypothetical protein